MWRVVGSPLVFRAPLATRPSGAQPRLPTRTLNPSCKGSSRTPSLPLLDRVWEGRPCERRGARRRAGGGEGRERESSFLPSPLGHAANRDSGGGRTRADAPSRGAFGPTRCARKSTGARKGFRRSLLDARRRGTRAMCWGGRKLGAAAGVGIGSALGKRNRYEGRASRCGMRLVEGGRRGRRAPGGLVCDGPREGPAARRQCGAREHAEGGGRVWCCGAAVGAGARRQNFPDGCTTPPPPRLVSLSSARKETEGWRAPFFVEPAGLSRGVRCPRLATHGGVACRGGTAKPWPSITIRRGASRGWQAPRWSGGGAGE